MADQMKVDYGAQVEWHPFLLRPDMPDEGQELPAAIRAKAQQVGGRLKQMAEANGLPMVMSTWTPNPRRAHEATAYAYEKGRGEEFHRVVFRQYYGEGQDIGHWEVLRAAAAEVALDPEEMQRAVESGAYRARVEEQIDEAHALGINSVPTYVLNDRYAIVGAQPYSVFKQVVERLQSEPSEPEE